MNELLTAIEAAALLRLAPQTLAKYRSIGGGPPYAKVGRSCLYARADLDTWIADRRMTSTSSRPQHVGCANAKSPR